MELLKKLLTLPKKAYNYLKCSCCELGMACPCNKKLLLLAAVFAGLLVLGVLL